MADDAKLDQVATAEDKAETKADNKTDNKTDDTIGEVCPKCGKKRQPPVEACPRCGLVFARWSRDDGAPLARLDDAGQALWRRILENFSDTALHEEFLRHCLTTGTLAAAGRKYRERLDDNPKDSVALHMQQQVLSKAALGLEIHKSQPRQALTRTRWFWVVVLTAMSLGIAGGLFWRRLR